MSLKPFKCIRCSEKRLSSRPDRYCMDCRMNIYKQVKHLANNRQTDHTGSNTLDRHRPFMFDIEVEILERDYL